MQLLGCIACNMQGRYAEPDIHHLVSLGPRNHQRTIPLCPAHHRGVFHDEAVHGPSLANGSKPFREYFGTDEFLLAKVNLELGL
jgi:hypothetical protein